MEQNQRSNNTLIKVFLAIAIAVAVIFGYLYMNTKTELSERNVDVTEKTKELLMANTKLDSISTQLDARIAEVTALGGQVEELEALKAQLEKDKKRLIYSKNVSLKEYQDKITGYENALITKDTEIATLRENNSKLATKNMNLSNEVSTLATERDQLISTKKELSDSVYAFSAKNKELSEKVSLASALRPVSYNVSAINSRGRERNGPEFKSRRVEKIKVSFSLAENPLTTKENKVVYMRLLGPSGTVISDMATGSGAFKHSGKETVYTAKQTIRFTNTGQVVNFIYDRGAEYEPGEYSVELYSEGYKLGKTSFSVK